MFARCGRVGITAGQPALKGHHGFDVLLSYSANKLRFCFSMNEAVCRLDVEQQNLLCFSCFFFLIHLLNAPLFCKIENDCVILSFLYNYVHY